MKDQQHEPVHSSFDPIVNSECTLLILGSLPGPESLASGQYYKRAGNSFWPIMFTMFNGTPTDSYSEKCSLLLRNKIALWDVFRSASRQGAADTAITNGRVNDFNSFFTQYPNIRGIIFNGSKAHDTFKRSFPQLYKQIPNETVWSSSGACARKFEDKLGNWLNAFYKLEESIG